MLDLLILALPQISGPFGVILAKRIINHVSAAFCIVLFLAIVLRML